MDARWVALAAALVVACEGGGGTAPSDAAAPIDATDVTDAAVDAVDAGDAAKDASAPDSGPDASGDSGAADVPDVQDTEAVDAQDAVDAGPGDATDTAGDVNDAADGSDAADVADASDAVLDAGTDASPDAEEDADAAIDAAADATDVGEPDTGPWVPPVDCSAIPQGPFELAPVQGAMASEDIAFDKLGHVVGSNDKAIFKTAYGGAPQVFVPKLDFRAGMRYLPNGHLVVCNNYKGQLDRIDEKGEVHVLLTGLSYPNGITVDMKGFVYFTEHDANQVWRVDPFTGDKSLLTNKIANPNGITFSVDYRTLYIGGFSGVGTVYSMSISEDGVPGKLVPFATGVGTGWLDGMGVDACGNVYIADYGATIIYRISPDGQTNTPIVNGSSLGAYLPNLDWGSGIGGWDTESIYLPNGWQKGVFEVDLGVPSKPLPYP